MILFMDSDIQSSSPPRKSAVLLQWWWWITTSDFHNLGYVWQYNACCLVQSCNSSNHNKVNMPSMFQAICGQFIAGRFVCIIFVLYRSGSAAVQPSFCDELSAVLNHVAIHQVSDWCYWRCEYTSRSSRRSAYNRPTASSARWMLRSAAAFYRSDT